jgi:Skp family chaperone for outer membrane proteins
MGLILASLFGAASNAAAEVNIGTVEVEKIRKESPRFQEALKDIDDMVEEFERRRDDKQEELQSLAEDLEVASSAGGSRFERLRQEMMEKSQEYQQFMEETFGTEGIIETKSSEWLAPLYADLAEAGKKAAKTLGLDLILDLEQINPLFAGDNIDVTDAVLEEFLKMR